jgi:hypothetical protein
MPVAAVLFDWRGTLAHSPPPRWWAERGLEAAGRAVVEHEVVRIEAALLEAGGLDGIDVSAEAHRRETLGVFGRHGLDDALAGVLYALDADPVNHPLYRTQRPSFAILTVAVSPSSATSTLICGPCSRVRASRR